MEKTTVAYIRAPLKVAIPSLGDLQSHKNPFSKPKAYATISLSGSKLLPNTQNMNLLGAHANTVPIGIGITPPHPNSVPIQRHKLPSFDIDECITGDIHSFQYDDSSELSSWGGSKIDINQYKVELTNEVIRNFKIIQSINFNTKKETKFRKVMLGKDSTNKKMLLLDLDDTLIHTMNPGINYENIDINEGMKHNVFFKDLDTMTINSIKVIIRPYAVRLLEELSQFYEIAVISVIIIRYSQQE